MTIKATNEGQARFTINHAPSGQFVRTDPPAGHGGDGTSFAPTDLVDAALVACTGTMIGLKAQALGLDPKGLSISASHTMGDAPRRIASIDMAINITFPTDDRQKKSLIAAAKGCPVRNSLSEKMTVKLTFDWADGQTDVVGE
jgi:uncharacterized OsmC-like protein